MRAYSSSNLKIFGKNCPAALGFYEAETPIDRDFFNAGICAHACMQEIVKKGATDPVDQRAVCDAVCSELITVGRSYNNVPEPPMAPDDAFAGREIAMNYLAYHELPESVIINEAGLGITADGQPCAYDADDVRFRAILDLGYLDTVGDEEFQARVLVIRDWKSAWPTNETELETLQRRGQAVVAWLHHGDAIDGVRQEVVNLRTGMHYTNDIFFDDEGMDLLNRWRKDLLATCDAADKTREARPGVGCVSCWYRAGCEDCLAAYNGEPADDALRYVALEALRAEIVKPLRAKARVSPIVVEGGTVAYKEQKKKIPTENAIDKLLEYWFMDQIGDEIDVTEHELRGLLMALALPASSYEKAAKVIFPEKGAAAFDDMIEACITTKTESRFGIQK